MAQKYCPSCQSYKPRTDKHWMKNRARSDGFHHICTPCELERSKRKSARNAAKNLPKPEKKYIRPLDAQTYIITSAQNSTPVHEAFLATLKVAAKYLGAELVVIPLRYKNPTQPAKWQKWTKDEITGERRLVDDWWDPDVVPYLYNGRKKLNPNLVLAADIKTSPTATTPLTGWEALTGKDSCIVGHPKMQLKVVPTMSATRYPKILTTTGSCTQRNYSDTRAGKTGEFHHFLGAIIVEIHGNKFHLRQLNADRETGEFYDANPYKLYTRDGVKDAAPALGVVLGDVHARFASKSVDNARFGDGGLVETVDAQTLVWHDTLDGYAINPHHKDNPFIAVAKSQANYGNIKDEVKHAVDLVVKRTGKRKSVIVASNHDNFLARWIINGNWKTEVQNGDFYLETALAMRRSVTMGPGGTRYADPFPYWGRQWAPKTANIQWLERDESYKILDIEVGSHGDEGPNGAFGTMKNFARVGTKVITGHRHTPGIEEGHYGVGTGSELQLEYNHGPSSWLGTDCVIYPNGKRSLVNYIEGHWRP